ncbi:MAG: PilZ domain-containing protein [Nitrospiraceae bacterium]|nr:MAG: PilZ domain-containing protein [Nitrospiraceae bacterium]
MAVKERRLVERYDVFLVAEFRTSKGLHDYSMGVIGDFSPEGFSLESQKHDLKPGETVELIIKHPRNDLSVSALGEIVWSGEAWYKCMAGIKFSEMDQGDRIKILELISQVKNLSPEPALDHTCQTRSEEVSPVAICDQISKSLTRDEDAQPDKLTEFLSMEINRGEFVNMTEVAGEQIPKRSFEGYQNYKVRYDVDMQCEYGLLLKDKDRRKNIWLYALPVTFLGTVSIIVIFFSSLNKTNTDTVVSHENSSLPLQKVEKEQINLSDKSRLQDVPAKKISKPAKGQPSVIKKKGKLPVAGKQEQKTRKETVPPQKTPQQQLSEDIALFQKAQLLTYKEVFSNNKNNWRVFETDEATAFIEDGVYQIWNKAGSGILRILHYHDFPHERDFIIETSIKTINGSGSYSYGLILGGRDEDNNLTFQIRDDGRYFIREYHDGIPRSLKAGQRDGIMNKNSTNILKIVKLNGNIRFCINDVLVDSISNVSFSGNKIGYIIEGKAEIAVYKEISQVKVESSSASGSVDAYSGQSL